MTNDDTDTDADTGTDDTTPEPVTPALIEEWALEPANRARAIAFGRRLITAKDADALREQDSLGEFEDRATEWALNNNMRAKMLVMKLLGKLKPTAAEIAGTTEDAAEE